MRSWLAVAVTVALGACESPASAPGDAGGAGPLDAGDAGDSGPFDAGAADAHLLCGWEAVDAGVPDPADLDAPGRYAAGVRTLELTDASRARTLPVEVWYPVDRTGTGGVANVYNLDTSLGRLASACTPARRDAPAAVGDWPVVIFSHGFGGIRFQSYFLTEHLASHGFVVVAPDHPGNTLANFATLGDAAAAAQSAIDRPLDVLYVLARLEEGWLTPIVGVDPSRIAVSGHSFGGWTAVESARRDARLRVVVALAPGFRAPSSPAIAGELARPLMLMGGTADRTTPFDTDQQAAFDVATPPKALVRIDGAGHMDFTDVCGLPTIRGLFDDGCDPASVDPVLVQSRVRVLALAFLRRWLTGDVTADAELAPARVSSLSGITYWYEPGP